MIETFVFSSESIFLREENQATNRHGFLRSRDDESGFIRASPS